MTDQIKKEAVYVGRTELSNGKNAYVWLIDGEEKLFSKVSGQVIGGVYEIMMTPDGRSVFHNSQSYTGQKISDTDQIAAWEAVHRLVLRRQATAAAERKHKGDSELERALEPLDHIVARLRNRNEAYALAKMVEQHVLETYWKGKK